jgi:hypothetical protein
MIFLMILKRRTKPMIFKLDTLGLNSMDVPQQHVYSVIFKFLDCVLGCTVVFTLDADLYLCWLHSSVYTR